MGSICNILVCLYILPWPFGNKNFLNAAHYAISKINYLGTNLAKHVSDVYAETLKTFILKNK